jgi:uncharacterized PurR-regulated membrane protein YhhQ (DUF165 family)
VIGSNIVGSIVDTALFLVLAFGSISYLTGQVVGKTAMIVVALPLVWAARNWVRGAVLRNVDGA